MVVEPDDAAVALDRLLTMNGGYVGQEIAERVTAAIARVGVLNDAHQRGLEADVVLTAREKAQFQRGFCFVRGNMRTDLMAAVRRQEREDERRKAEKSTDFGELFDGAR